MHNTNDPRDPRAMRPSFLDLDPIPEDASVAAAVDDKGSSNIAAASFDAASTLDSVGDFAIKARNSTNTNANTNININNNDMKRKIGRRRQRGDHKQRLFDSGREGSDNVSDANASLGVPEESEEKGEEQEHSSSPNSKKQQRKATVKNTPNCTGRTYAFWTITLLLVIGIVIGCYFIVEKTLLMENNDALSQSLLSSTSPSSSPDSFPPSNLMVFPLIPITDDDDDVDNIGVGVPGDNNSLLTAQPSSSSLLVSSIYTKDEIDQLDEAFLNVYGTNEKNLYDINTPQGICRQWIMYLDRIKLNAETETDKERAQQRYILCVFYYATNGEYWKTNNWLDSKRSECEWTGLICRNTTEDTNSTNIVTDINLRDNNITGPIQKEIASLSNLNVLNLTNNFITGTIPDNIFNMMDELVAFKVENNFLTGTIPPLKSTTRIGTTASSFSSKLEKLKVGNNKLVGKVPFFPSLKKLWISNNTLESFDIMYTTSLPSLVEIRAYSNSLTGTLPIEWNGPNLTKLDLGINNLTGTIPQYIWNMPVLKHLYLDHNNFTGTLPASSKSTTLEHVWVDSNSLTGIIPTNFGWNWTELHELKLQKNSLAGNITIEQCDRWKQPDDMDVLTNSSCNNNDNNKTNITDGKERPDWSIDTDCNIACDCCDNCLCTFANDVENKNESLNDGDDARRRR